MQMKIGYACLMVGVPGTTIKTTRKANATSDRLMELIRHNLQSMERMIDYNIEHEIKMYRISSDIIPFASDFETNQLDWQNIFKDTFDRLGEKIKKHHLRVSMHPGQYTVLNSPQEGVVKRAIDDLEYHTQFLDALGVDDSHKIILHIGGVYGDIEAAKKRFIETYKRLSSRIKARLIIENDHSLYTISDVLEISKKTGAPVVYDNLHNACNPSDPTISDAEWIRQAKKTWGSRDGRMKIHYSQQSPGGRLGAHTQTIYIKPFMAFYQEISPLEVDIMLEVKDKNLSAMKANLATTTEPDINDLEKEWARYKYAVLSHSPKNYQAIRTLLKDKSTYPVIEFYERIEEALDTVPDKNVELNAIEHVWGHLKKKVSDKEAEKFSRMKQQWIEDQIKITRLKKWLRKRAEKVNDAYLLQSLYFDLD